MSNPEFTLHYLPTPDKLTPEQEEHWRSELEQAQKDQEMAERRIEDCRRILKIGRLAVELGLDG